MGGYDAYCALCGARTPKDYLPDDDDEGEYYDPAIILEKDMLWMDDVRIICFNPESSSRDKYALRSSRPTCQAHVHTEYMSPAEQDTTTMGDRSYRQPLFGWKCGADESRFFDATPGDDPNVPTPDQAEYTNGKLNMRVYDQGEGGPISYPVRLRSHIPSSSSITCR